MYRSCFSFASFWVACAILAAENAYSQQGFPYEAVVGADDVYVRSGPGTEYYPTGKLKIGETVEVYRHDPGGWCAIRPPQGSFTWVSSRFLEARKDRLGEIIGSRVAARVGSSFSTIRDVIQVRLQKGELVEILETSPDGAWTKVSPPSGEFRWIHQQYLANPSDNSGLRNSGTESSPMTDRTFSHANEQSRELEPSARYAGDASRLTSLGDDVSPESDFPSAGAPRLLSPEEFASELDDLNIELSMMVAEEPTVWEFGELASRAQGLLMQAETAVERGHARVLLTKIRRFEDIRERYRTVNSLASKTESLNRRYAGQPATERVSSSTDTGRYDGAGRLTRVDSPKTGAPRFALMDDRGQIRCFVTPAPGLNMQYYLGKEIGVNGMRGYVPEQRAPHITAKHVEVLDGSIMR